MRHVLCVWCKLTVSTMPTDTQAIIFDFDYTLADSSPGVIECINFALGEMGLDHVPAEAACRTIGLSLHETFVTLGEHHEPHRGDEFHELFISRADQVMANLTTLFESVPATVATLNELGLRMGIVSTKYRRRIHEVLHREDLLHAFQVIIGGEDVKQHKPHTEGLLKAIAQLQCSPKSILYVGDSVVDAELATRADVPFVIVLSGVTPREHFTDYKPLGVIENVSQLPELLG